MHTYLSRARFVRASPTPPSSQHGRPSPPFGAVHRGRLSPPSTRHGRRVPPPSPSSRRCPRAPRRRPRVSATIPELPRHRIPPSPSPSPPSSSLPSDLPPGLPVVGSSRFMWFSIFWAPVFGHLLKQQQPRYPKTFSLLPKTILGHQKFSSSVGDGLRK